MPSPSQHQINTLVGMLTLGGMLITGVFYIAPLKTLPDDLKVMRSDMQQVQQTQAVQAETIKMLADVSKQTAELRRDLDKTKADTSAHQTVQESRLTSVQIRVSRLERGAITAAEQAEQAEQ